MGRELQLLGPPRARVRDDAWQPLAATRPNALLAFVGHRGGPVRREELAALLWPEIEDARAFANLRQTLRTFALGELAPLLERDRRSVWTAARTDVSGFLQACADGRLADACGGYGGPFLHRFEVADAPEFGAWLDGERAHLHELWRDAALRHADDAIATGHWDEALRLADRLLQADPIDTSALRAAWRAAAGGGDAHGVRRRAETFAARWRAELDEDVDADLMRDGEVWWQEARKRADAPLPEDASASRGPRSPPEAAAAGTERQERDPARPLGRPRYAIRPIGRDAAIADVAARVAHDPGVALLLLGPGGIGKSVLAEAVAGAVVRDFADGVAVARLETLPDWPASLRAIANAVGAAIVDGPPVDAQIADALGRRHVLLLLDGIEPHVDEPGLAAFLDLILARCPRTHLLLTSRERLRHSRVSVIAVAPLARRARFGRSPAAQLFLRAVARLAGRDAARAAAAVAERIASQAGGVPLALELAASWADVLPPDQLERELEGGWDLLRTDDVDRSSRRRDMRAIFEEVWLRLEPRDRQAWARLASLPGTVDRSVAASVVGTGWRGLGRLRDRGVVRWDGDRAVLHDLLARYGAERARETGWADGAWDAALAAVRQRWPLAAGDPRPLQHPDDLELAVGAWWRAVAVVDAEALAHLSIALFRAMEHAGRGREVGDLARAAWVALEALPGPGGPSPRQPLAAARRRALARVLPFAGRTAAERRRALLHAMAAARAVDDPLALAVAAGGLLFLEPGDRAEERFACARAAHERAGDQVGLRQLLTERGGDLALRGRFREADRLLTTALALTRELGDRLAEAEVHDARSTTALLRGDLAQVRTHLDAAWSGFATEGAAFRSALSLASETWLAMLAGGREDAERRLATFEQRLAPYGGAPVASAVLRASIGFHFGDDEAFVAAARRALELVGAPQRVGVVAALMYAMLAERHVAARAWDEAVAALSEAARMARVLDAPRFLAHTALVAAILAEASGEPALAGNLLGFAAGHPALEYERLTSARALAARLVLPWPPPAVDVSEATAWGWLAQALAAARRVDADGAS